MAEVERHYRADREIREPEIVAKLIAMLYDRAQQIRIRMASSTLEMLSRNPAIDSYYYEEFVEELEKCGLSIRLDPLWYGATKVYWIYPVGRYKKPWKQAPFLAATKLLSEEEYDVVKWGKLYFHHGKTLQLQFRS